TENNEIEKQLSIYPNPAQNHFVLKLATHSKNNDIIIYNNIGQIQKVISNINSSTITIETSDLSNGVYFIAIQSNSKKVNGKLIINK
ncbi:MAG: T9SS type A sorting domain-containing protein, partial [Runella sp.]